MSGAVELKPLRPLLALLAAAALAGCSVGKDLATAETAIASFHQLAGAGQFDRVYDGSSEEIKGTTSKAAFTALLSAIHGKLGAFKSGSKKSWNDNAGTSGHVVTIVYSATYEHGPAEEDFVFRMNGDRVLLAGYHVNANALLAH